MSWNASRPPNTRAAHTMRARVLREQPICAHPGCEEPATEDDHIVGWSQREKQGMTVAQWHARSNHQGLCEPHHQAKTRREAAAGRTKPARPRRPHPSDPS